MNKLDPLHATREIQRRVKNGGEVRFSSEVQRDMANPRDWGHTVTLDEVNECLKTGRVLDAPEYDLAHEEWRYRMELVKDTHKLIVVTVIISESDALRVITRFKKRQNYNRRAKK